jgi:hypothetical protein
MIFVRFTERAREYFGLHPETGSTRATLSRFLTYYLPSKGSSNMPLDKPKLQPQLITFPPPPEPGLSENDREVLTEETIRIHEIISGTSMALRELRTGVLNLLFDLLERLDLDTWTLSEVLDVSPSQARELIAKECDELTTETILEYLERLRP